MLAASGRTIGLRDNQRYFVARAQQPR